MNIFIHYLDKELLDLYSGKNYSEELIAKVVMSIKVAILLVDKDEAIYIPTSSYFESKLGKVVLEYFRDIIDLGIIKLVSSSKTLVSFINKKKIVYPSIYTKEDIEAAEEQLMNVGVPGMWTQRKNSATHDIMTGWSNNINSSTWEEVYRLCNYRNVSTFENSLASIPKKLKDKAFVVSHVLPELRIDEGGIISAKELINEEITRYYIDSFLKEYNAVCFKKFFLLGTVGDDILPQGYSHIDYTELCRNMVGIKYGNETLYAHLVSINNFSIYALKENEIIKELLNTNHNCIRNNTKKTDKGDRKMEIKNFIVHGHDGAAKLELKNYIQNTLKLSEPVILAEKASKGMTIIEKFEQYSEDCKLVFVLLTPDDIYGKDNLSRARQNVIFEMGYFLGKLGRRNGKVLLLYKGQLDVPNDISGVIYINIDNGIEAAGEEIRRELSGII